MHQIPSTEGERRERTQDIKLIMRHQPQEGDPDAQADAYGRPLGNAVKHLVLVL
jgi:hypothetical protein